MPRNGGGSSRPGRRASTGGNLTRRAAPPDPRPSKANQEHRKLRQELEKEHGGFDWSELAILGVTAMTALLSFDKAYDKYSQRHEEREKAEEEERKRREGESSSRRRRASSERDRRRYSDDDYWSEDERDAEAYYGRRSSRGRSRPDARGLDRDLNRGYPRGYSVDYDRYRGPRRETTW